MKALAYLGYRQAINRLKFIIRSPKRLFIGILTFLWIAFMVVSFVFEKNLSSRVVPYFGEFTAVEIETLWSFIFISLNLGSLAIIYSSLSEGLLVFSIPEVDFLFSAPINKRLVLLTKLLRDHTKAAFWTGFFVTLLSRTIRQFTSANFFPEILVVWLALFLFWTFLVHTSHTVNVIATFKLARLRYAKASIKIIFATLAIALIFSALTFSVTPLPPFFFSVSFLAKVIFPARWAANVIMAPVWGVTNDTLLNLTGLFAISTAAMLVLLSLRYNIYESALSVSAKTARISQTIENTGMAAFKAEQILEKGTSNNNVLSIPAFGKGASTLLWKNITVRLRVASFLTTILILLPTLVCLSVVKAIPDRIVKTSGLLPFVILAYLIWVVSWTALKELRSELRQAQALKAMPFSTFETVFYLSLGAAFTPLMLTVSGILSIWAILPNTKPGVALCALMGLASFTVARSCLLMMISLIYPNMRDSVQDYQALWLAFILDLCLVAPSIALVAVGLIIEANPLIIGSALLLINTGASGLFLIISEALYRRLEPESE